MSNTSIRRTAAPVLALLLASAALSACSPTPESTEAGPLLVWTDATRQPAVEAYQAAHPDVEIEVEVVDITGLASKLQLANRVGEGWPDLTFAYPEDVANFAGPLYDFAQPLGDLVPQDVQDGFATESQACTIDGTLYCLQNDIAQGVIWYDQPLLEQFGYEIPTTWDEYQELGNRVAQEHPGYLIGAVGDVNIWYDHLWGSGCPVAEVTDVNQVRIDTSDEKCTRVGDLFDPLLQNGSVSRLSPFDPTLIQAAQEGKVLMMPGPSWFGEFLLKADTGYALPDGKIAAAPIPSWDGESTNYSGAWGGGVFVVSSHSSNKQGAADLAQWITTADEYQTTAPTYPAYKPAAEAWSAARASDVFYAEDPAPVLAAGVDKINPAVAPTRYAITPVMTATLVAAIKDGGSIAEALPSLQSQLVSLAQGAGYEVIQ